MKRILIYIMCIQLLWLPSCSTEEVIHDISNMAVDMNISTRSLDPAVKLRIIVAEKRNNKIIINTYPASADPSDGEYKIRLQTGEYYFYLLANEPERLTPFLSQITNRSQLSGLDIRANELPEEELPLGNSLSATNIPSLGMRAAVVRAKSGSENIGEISSDNGNSWSNTLEVGLERLAIKLSFYLRKLTPNANDNLIIRNVSLINIPGYGHILNESYRGTNFQTLSPCEEMSGFLFSSNSNNYQGFFDGLILPEYIMSDPTNGDMAITVKIEATYNGKNVLYHVPIRKSLQEANYSLKRNLHYIIPTTITTQGEVIYIPEVSYQVANWDDAIDDPSFIEAHTIRFTANWAGGTNIDIPAREVHVGNGKYVEYHFTLAQPSTASWTAVLTNPIDFMFDDSNGAVSHGRTKEGETYIIRIKPRRETSLNDIKTEFFITVNNGVGNVELNLPESHVGTGNRYTIIQIPN